MKKSLLLGLFICSFLNVLADNGMNIGGRIGFNMSKLSTDEGNIESEARIGYHLGGFIRFNRGDKFYIQPGVDFCRYSVDIKPIDSTLSSVGTEDLDFNYLHIPLMFGYRIIGNTDGFALRIHAGPAYDINLGIKDNDFGITDDDLEPGFWSVKAGAGIDFLFLTLDVDYNWGLTDLPKDFDSQNRMLMITAGVKF